MGARLGQHFLKNSAFKRRIVDALHIEEGDTIVEIGPGRGALTRAIVYKFTNLQADKFRVIAIEKDEKLAEALRLEIGDENLEIIAGDALAILPTLSYQLTNLKTYKLVGNIPYYITGKLLRIIGELEHKPSLIVLMVQREVAERISAKPPHMNLLAASVQFWADTEYLFSVSRKEFSPMPKVDSGVIRLRTRKNPVEALRAHGAGAETNAKTRELYYATVRALFRQPRKTVLNNALSIARTKDEAANLLRDVGIDPESRPQNLSVEKIINLSRFIVK